MTNTETLTVVGLGYVGLPSAALMAQAGYQTHGVDVNAALIADLQAGQCPLSEPEVVEVVTKALASGRLTAQTKAAEADIFIICVPTPVGPDNAPDLSMVKAAMQATAPFVRAGNMVILESTSPINTTRDVIAKSLEDVGLDPLKDVDVCYCPERVFPGRTVQEILHNDRVVGGLTPRAGLRAKAFYESFCQGSASVTTAAGAEFSKLMENTYRDVNIAMANVFARIAEEAGVDVNEVIGTANLHPRVNVHTPGPGVGGHCIPVDPWFLIDAFPEAAGLLELSRNINDGQPRHFLERAKQAGLPERAKIGLLGAAYRGNIDDARDSPTAIMISEIAKDGGSWMTHDPFVTSMHIHGGYPANITDQLSVAIDGMDAVFILTDHDAYASLEPELFSKMRSKLIVDTRRMLDAERFAEAGFTVISVGSPTSEKTNLLENV